MGMDKLIDCSFVFQIHIVYFLFILFCFIEIESLHQFLEILVLQLSLPEVGRFQEKLRSL